MFSPLEQFGLQLLYPVRIVVGGMVLDISITRSLILFIGVLFILRCLVWGTRRYIWFTQSQQVIGDMLLMFVYVTVVQQTGVKGLRFYPMLVTLFCFILVMNILGLFPLSFTNTSQIGITATLGFSMMLGIIILGFYLKGWRFILIFVPSNVPSVLLPFLVMIEFISFMIRPVSLSLRLCANMMAGHILLNIIGSFVYSLWCYNHGLAALGVWILLLAVVMLEVGIAFLQAYVFLMLVSVYLNDAIGMGH